MSERSILALGLLCAILVLMPSAAAQTVVPVSGPVSETVTIPVDEWRAYSVSIASQDSFEYSARVTQGGNIDVYLMTVTGYSQYTSPTAPSFEYLVSGTQENTASFSKSVSPNSGTYYLVVDNSNVSANGASGTAPVTVAVTAQVRPFPIAFAAGGILLFVVVIVVLLVLLARRRKKRRAMMPPPMPPGAPPPMPPTQGPPMGP